MRRFLLPRRLAAAGLGALLSVVPAAAAWARWSGAGTGTGTGTAGTMAAPTGLTLTKPVATTVRVGWTASTAPGGGAVDGYYVTRLAGSTPAAACATSATKLTAATTCDDTGLAGGTYTYTVTAVYRTWTAVSAASSSITVTAGDAPPTVVGIVRAGGAAAASSTNGTRQWTVTFTESVTGVTAGDFALAASGLGGTPTVTDVSGSGATWTVTASTGSGSGTLGLNLVDDDSIADAAGNKLGGAGTGNGNATGATYSLNRIIASVALVNGTGTAGTIDSNDQIVIRFSRAMNPNTICGSWTQAGSTLVDANSATGGTKVTVALDGSGFGGGSGNDTLTLTSSNCVGSLRFGTINLASPGYVNGLRNFALSPMIYDPANFTLTIKLGPSDNGSSTANVTSAAPIYTAAAGITDSNGVAVNNSPFGLSAQMWF